MKLVPSLLWKIPSGHYHQKQIVRFGLHNVKVSCFVIFANLWDCQGTGLTVKQASSWGHFIILYFTINCSICVKSQFLPKIYQKIDPVTFIGLCSISSQFCKVCLVLNPPVCQYIYIYACVCKCTRTKLQYIVSVYLLFSAFQNDMAIFSL
jgi:hypothetical protein